MAAAAIGATSWRAIGAGAYRVLPMCSLNGAASPCRVLRRTCLFPSRGEVAGLCVSEPTKLGTFKFFQRYRGGGYLHQIAGALSQRGTENEATLLGGSACPIIRTARVQWYGRRVRLSWRSSCSWFGSSLN